MLDYSIKLPKNRRSFPVGFYVMPYFMNVLILLLQIQVKQDIIKPPYYAVFHINRVYLVII